MCEPTTIIAVAAVVSATTAVAGAGVAIHGNLEAAKAAEDQGKYQQRMAMYDAQAKANAGKVEAFKQGVAQRQEIGKRKARAAAKHKDLTFGSEPRLLKEIRAFHAMDSLFLAENVRSAVLGAQLGGQFAKYSADIQKRNFQFGAAAAGVQGVSGLAQGIALFAYSGTLSNDTSIPDFEEGMYESSSPSVRRKIDYGPITPPGL